MRISGNDKNSLRKKKYTHARMHMHAHIHTYNHEELESMPHNSNIFSTNCTTIKNSTFTIIIILLKYVCQETIIN